MTEENSNPFLGILVHFGLFSIPAFDDVKSASKRSIINGSEWYKKRLEEDTNAYRPTSGAKATKEYHEKHYPDMDYSDFAKMFKPDLKNIDSWTKLAKNIGASYMILTAKHHDGYSLYPSEVGLHSKKDIVQYFKDSCERNGIKFGLYYSWMEFDKSCTKDYLNEVVKVQIDELITYKPKVIFFDGDWACRSKYSLDLMEELCKKIKKKIPNVVINDRVGIKFTSENELGFIDYRVYADRYIPTKKPTVPWTHINTISLSWGRNKQQKDKDYKTVKELTGLYTRVRKLVGSFLINIGPNADGSLDPIEEERLLGFGRAIKDLKEESNAEEELEEESSESEEISKQTKFKAVKDLRIFAWNGNGIRSLMNKDDNLRNFLYDHKPDILFFPETKGNPKSEEKAETDLEEIFENALPDSKYSFYWTYSEVPGRFGNCLAISSKYKIEEIRYSWKKGEIDPEGRIIIIKLKNLSLVEGKGIYILGLYVPNASTELKRLQFKLEWLKKLRKTMDKLKAKNNTVIVIGDINVAPTEQDISKPKGNERSAGFTIEERKQFQELLGKEYVDVWREKNPLSKDVKSGNIYTYFNNKFNARASGNGWRIDLILMDKETYNQNIVNDVGIYPKYLGSDHCPVGMSVTSKKKIKIKISSAAESNAISILDKKLSYSGNIYSSDYSSE